MTAEHVESDEPREPFVVDNDRKADWAMRRLRETRLARLELATRAQAEIDPHQAEIDRIRAWQKGEDAKLAPDADYFRGLMEAYALSERERTKDDRKPRMSISTPHGAIKTRATGASWDIENEAAFVAWLKEHHPHLVKTTDAVRLADAKKALDAIPGGFVIDPDSGEVVPGVKVGEPGVSASVDVDLGVHAEGEEEGT